MEKLNKYKRWNTQLHLYNNMYWDFVLSQDNTPYENINGNTPSKEECLSSYIDFSNNECIEEESVVSLPKYVWQNAISSFSLVKDFGFTGIDNGRVIFDNTISNEEYYKILTASYLVEFNNDSRLRLYRVTGNTHNFSYPIEYNETEKFYALKGGFFQGFFKLFGFDYQVLPQYIENEWNLEFVIRPQDYEEEEATLNSKNNGKNKGLFFYMGTRAENKFAQYYDSEIDNYPDRVADFCCGENYFEFDWDDGETAYSKFKAEFFAFLLLTPFNCSCKTPCISCKSYTEDETYQNLARECELYFGDGYLQNDEELNRNIETSDGAGIKRGGYYEIKTDNKFLTFDRTKKGLTTDSPNKNAVVTLYGYKDNSSENKFLTFSRTKNGETADNEATPKYKYNIKNDIKNNAFALKINDDGSIGYRYIISDCDEGIKIVEEHSYPNLVRYGKWSVINAKIQIINGNTDDCGTPMGKRKMRIMLYVDGNLVFISKELPEFNFNEFDEIYAKQEGVPFNISIGGGTQGLSDAWIVDKRCPFNKVLPLEDNFAGTFIGDIKSFKFYTCPLNINEIRNNYLFEKQKI